MTDPMMAITLHAHWAHGVAHLGKRIENRKGRPWARLVGQRVAIHASAHVGGRKSGKATVEGLKALGAACFRADGIGIEWSTLPHPRVLKPGGGWRTVVTSAIVCTAVIVRLERNAGQPPHPWADPRSRFWWHLAGVEVLPVPVPCGGHQGFWPAPSLEGGAR